MTDHSDDKTDEVGVIGAGELTWGKVVDTVALGRMADTPRDADPWTEADSEAYAALWAQLGRRPGVDPTAEQVVRFIRAGSVRFALELAGRLLQLGEGGSRCREQGHNLELLQLRTRVAELEPPHVVHAYPADRHTVLGAASEDLHAMQGQLQRVRAGLHDLPDVTRASQAVAKIEPAIEAAQNAVLEAWDGEP